MENRNEVKIGEGTYIVERSFTPGKSVKDLLVQRLISEKRKEYAESVDKPKKLAADCRKDFFDKLRLSKKSSIAGLFRIYMVK